MCAKRNSVCAIAQSDKSFAGHIDKTMMPQTDRERIILANPADVFLIRTCQKGHSLTLRLSILYINFSVMVIETRKGLQYTSIGEVTNAFTEFISLKKVSVKVYQTLADPQRLQISFVDSHSKSAKRNEEAQCYTYTETELLLNEGDVVAYSFKGNIQNKNKFQMQFRYHALCGFKTYCLIDVQNPYGQRSLPTFHGIVQIFSQTDDSRGSTDLKAEPDLSLGWECIAEVPVTLPKSIAKISSTVYRAPLSLQLEGNLS